MDSPPVGGPGPEFNFAIGLLQADLRIPESFSLKDKRSVVSGVLNHLRKNFPLSAAEVGHHDLWGRAGIAAVVVSGDAALAEKILEDAARWLSTGRDFELIDYSIERM